MLETAGRADAKKTNGRHFCSFCYMHFISFCKSVTAQAESFLGALIVRRILKARLIKMIEHDRTTKAIIFKRVHNNGSDLIQCLFKAFAFHLKKTCLAGTTTLCGDW